MIIKLLYFRSLALILILVFVFNSCEKDCDCNADDEIEISIIGEWQMNGTTKYGLDFTNYGIAIWKHKPYMNTDLDYSYNGTTLTVLDVVGKGVFSEDGDTLTISGFSDITSFGTEGSKPPYINGTYIRQ